LRRGGIESGMSVAVLVTIPLEGPIVQLAVHLLGCRIIWVACSRSAPEILAYLTLAPPDAFVYDPRTDDELARTLLGELPPIPVLCLGSGGAGPDLLADRPDETERPDPAELVGSREPDAVFQTSGTTGTPKAILHAHKTFRQVVVLAEDWVPSGHPVQRHV